MSSSSYLIQIPRSNTCALAPGDDAVHHVQDIGRGALLVREGSRFSCRSIDGSSMYVYLLLRLLFILFPLTQHRWRLCLAGSLVWLLDKQIPRPPNRGDLARARSSAPPRLFFARAYFARLVVNKLVCASSGTVVVSAASSRERKKRERCYFTPLLSLFLLPCVIYSDRE